MFIHPFNLIRINIWCIHLYSGRKIDNHWIFSCGSPFSLHSGTDFQGEIKFRTGKALRRILQNNLSRELSGTFFYHACSIYRNLNDFLTTLSEYHIPLQSRGRVINVYNCLRAPLNRGKGFIQQFLPALCQHLYFHIIRDQFSFNQLTKKIKFNLTGSRKAHFNFLKPQFDQIFKKFDFLIHHHRIDQRLVTVPQIHTAPHRRFFNLLTRPLSFRVIYHRIFSVSVYMQHLFSPIT